MKISDNKYNTHFRNMVIDAICLGLTHPIEWVESYGRAIGKDEKDYEEIQTFCNLALRELYGWITYGDKGWRIEDITMKTCNKWIKEYYRKK